MIDEQTRSKMVAEGAKAIFDSSMGGTSDPMLIDMLASICEQQAELAINAAMKAAEEDGWKLTNRTATESQIKAFPDVVMSGFGRLAEEYAPEVWAEAHDVAPSWQSK
jgi:hypothetical protein